MASTLPNKAFPFLPFRQLFLNKSVKKQGSFEENGQNFLENSKKTE